MVGRLVENGKEKIMDRNPNCPVCGQHSFPLTAAALAVLSERQRQVLKEGWTQEHDDQHTDDELAIAASCYAHHPTYWLAAGKWVPAGWPWAADWWKPKDRRSDLVRAAALLLAEIERLDRREPPNARLSGAGTASA